MIAFVIIFGILAIGVVLVVHGTVVKNRWGVNLGPVYCPHCKTPFPLVRKPQSLSQAMWGGSTCRVCGTEADKWGREVASPARFQNERSSR
jgi:hypothetical protein